MLIFSGFRSGFTLVFLVFKGFRFLFLLVFLFFLGFRTPFAAAIAAAHRFRAYGLGTYFLSLWSQKIARGAALITMKST